MNSFLYYRPHHIEELWQLMADHADGYSLLAGGTDLLVRIGKRRLVPKAVIDLKKINGLRADIQLMDGCLRIGALAVITDLVNHSFVQQRFPALVEAAAAVGSNQIRNRATLAGNICNASPAADTAPSLLIYGANLNLISPEGERSLAVENFFIAPGRTALKKNEILGWIDLPIPPEKCGSSSLRFARRRGFDLATVSVSCMVFPDSPARFGFGAVGPRPILAVDHFNTIIGLLGSPGEQKAARETLNALTSPIGDIRASREYRQAMLAAISERALRSASIRLHEKQYGVKE